MIEQKTKAEGEVNGDRQIGGREHGHGFPDV